jgi:predicted RNase H-like HicB family nuclease
MANPIVFTGRICKEGGVYVSYCDQLQAATSARTMEAVIRRTKELIQIHLEEAQEDGTLNDLIQRCGMEPIASSRVWKGTWQQIPYLLNLVVAQQAELRLHA